MFLTTAQVAQRYRISRTTVWRWIKAGRLPKPDQIGPGVKRFSVEALDRADAQWASNEGATT